MADDDVQLTDLEVIQRYSLAVRGATAPRADLLAALQADLDWLKSGRRTSARKPAAVAETDSGGKAPAKRAAKRAPAKRAAKG